MMECFNSLLLKLREAHEREVEGWQMKIQELSNKKGCDTRRMEELFSKNQQMKEQQRFLTENIKTLENRLRAGLCDRCTVTQELAKRRQQEFEASQVQSLQHLSLMAGEMNNLKKENKRLKEELKGLKAALLSTEHKPNTSPDLSPPSGPVPLVATATSKSSQPVDNEGVRKTEGEQRKEGSDQRPWKSSSRRYFDSYKPLSFPTRKSDHGASCSGEKSVEALDQQLFSAQSLLKSSSGGEVTPSRHVLHPPLPCRPQPIKGSPVSLPWSSPPASGLMRSPSHKSNMPPFPPLASAEGLCPGSVSIWHKQGAPKLNTAEQTVLFRLRSLPEHTDRKSLEKKENPACWTERASTEGPREAYEGPLDLSDPGKSTSNESPADYSPTSLGDLEPTQDNPDGHLKTDSSPSSSPKPLNQQEEEPAPDYQTQVGQEPEQRRDAMNGTKEQSSDKKVPVLTISLRPVVVLETLNSALQKQDSLTPNDKSSAAEPENSQQEQNSDWEGNQSCKRKRIAAVTDSDQDINHHQERKVKITMTTQEKGSS